ncbi:MAG: TonB-dependent receptor [Bacteroidales bacterium]|nr:TonB-dependent receptor [Bacteroidales bacterium]MCI2145091.1 TonB-dependent receptor [Bacteroidales bacterium]
MNQTIRRFALMLIGLVAILPVAFGQVTTSSMSGRITDDEGPLAGATVIASYTPAGTQYYAVTDKSGNFNLLNVRAGGPYTIKVSMLGYRDYEVTGVNVALSDNYVLNIEMKQESIGLEAIVVSADALSSNMRSDRAGAITTADTRTIETLPTVSRSLNDVLRLTPQAVVTSNGLAVGGGTYRGSYVTVDGAAFNNAFGIGSNLPAGGSPISLDALDQLSVSITPYDVRQSGFTGGSIQAVTKSGTNEFHMSAYDYYTSNVFEGKKYGKSDGTVGTLTDVSDMLKNTVGVTVGGPIIKDKLFFFFNFEYDTDIVPGQTRLARKSESDEWGGETQYNRPTVDQMDNMLKYLEDTYKYNPGRYQNYSASTPDYKLLARIDWNIDRNNHFNIRYSQTKNKYSSSPSSSVNPISPNPYNRNIYGRTSDCALYFESSRYFQEQNFSSIAAELSSRLMDGKLNNILRATYSHQYEPRSFVGDVFPTVDILENEGDTKEVLTTFGPDPFTYGNLRDVHTAVATDEISGQFGIHNLLAGVSFEYDKAVNGFMQGGAGYYVYDSWNDFVNDELPAAFAITYGNNNELSQVYPTFKTLQYSAYLQDEMSISDRFKLTAGVRFELPVYPSMAFNENTEFTTLMASLPTSDPLYGTKTCDIPATRLNVSPRVGFNWDVTGDRSVVLRGGTGVYTGRLPMVWLVSSVGNSNVLQNQYVCTTSEGTPHFHTSVSEILKDIKSSYPDATLVGDLTAPTRTTVIDKTLKLPMTWKTSLAVDVKLPWGVKGTIEGIYNKDLSSVCVYKGGQKLTGNFIQIVPGDASTAIPTWTSQGIKNSLNQSVTPYLITNSDVNGWYYSLTAKLEKSFDHGFSAMVAYTRSENQAVNDAVGDQVTSAYNTTTYNSLGSNTPELGYGTYVTPDHLVANVNYRIDYGKHFASTFGLTYEGYEYGYIGSYSYTRNSYVMGNSSSYSISNDGGAQTLLYVPTAAQLEKMVFTTDENKTAFWNFIEGNKYLKSCEGSFTKRGGEAMPWYNRLNFKFMEDFYFTAAGKKHDIQVGVDINNVANLLNPKWGNMKQMDSNYILSRANDGTYTYNTKGGIWHVYVSTYSTWSALFSIRYSF